MANNIENDRKPAPLSMRTYALAADIRNPDAQRELLDMAGKNLPRAVMIASAVNHVMNDGKNYEACRRMFLELAGLENGQPGKVMAPLFGSLSDYGRRNFARAIVLDMWAEQRNRVGVCTHLAGAIGDPNPAKRSATKAMMLVLADKSGPTPEIVSSLVWSLGIPRRRQSAEELLDSLLIRFGLVPEIVLPLAEIIKRRSAGMESAEMLLEEASIRFDPFPYAIFPLAKLLMNNDERVRESALKIIETTLERLSKAAEKGTFLRELKRGILKQPAIPLWMLTNYVEFVESSMRPVDLTHPFPEPKSDERSRRARELVEMVERDLRNAGSSLRKPEKRPESRDEETSTKIYAFASLLATLLREKRLHGYCIDILSMMGAVAIDTMDAYEGSDLPERNSDFGIIKSRIIEIKKEALESSRNRLVDLLSRNEEKLTDAITELFRKYAESGKGREVASILVEAALERKARRAAKKILTAVGPSNGAIGAVVDGLAIPEIAPAMRKVIFAFGPVDEVIEVLFNARCNNKLKAQIDSVLSKFAHNRTVVRDRLLAESKESQNSVGGDLRRNSDSGQNPGGGLPNNGPRRLLWR